MAWAQNNRLSDHNSIGWYSFNGTFLVTNKWSLHTEYQWRRDDVITNWQQSLLRWGVNYMVSPKLTLRLGYAYIETFTYGDFALQAAGKPFPEDRLYEAVIYQHKEGSVEWMHRLMLEQRWVGRFSSPSLSQPDSRVFSNRIRYMARMQFPIKGNTITNKKIYAALYDELFVGFGHNVDQNVFDQNRFGVLLGYQFSEKLRVEGGFLSQIVQLGRLVDTHPVFQYNTGFIINMILKLSLKKKA